jgi:hypothetical protein
MSNERNTVLYTARRNRLNEGLRTISDWCAKRAEGDYDDSTTITMLLRKVNELPHQVDKAGWRALAKFNQNETNTRTDRGGIGVCG